MIAATHFDPVVGVDIHIIQPPGPVPPVPVPHPFIGMVIDPMEYAPIIGGTVKVNGMMRGVAGTGGKNLPPHIPIGGVFVKPPSNECEIFMGSQTVAFDGDPASRLGLPALSCHCIGMPSPPRKKPHAKPKSLTLPTTVVMAVPKGPPVLIGGPPTISLMAMAMKFGMAVLGRALKKLRKMQKASKKWAGMSDKMRKAANKMLDSVPGANKLKNAVSNGICKLTGHPVDVATGKVTTESTDIELPGPLPFRFARVWYSNSDYEGPLGHGWHHSYDLGLYEFREGVVVRLPDGRFATFEPPESPIPGEAEFNRTEKLFLRRTADAYEVETLDGLVYSFSWRGGEGEERPLREVRDPNGNRIELVRENNKLIAFIDSGGRRLPVTTDKIGRITEIHGPDPENPGGTFPLVTFGYSRDGDLVEVLNALGHPFRYAYGNHLLLKETDRTGLSYYFMYDSDGPSARCLRTWGDGDVYLRDLTYDTGRTEVVDSLGHKTVYEWNEMGLVTAETDPTGGVTETEWGLFGEKLSITNPNGEKSSFAYDDFGRAVSVLDAAGGAVSFTYDAAGNPVSFTDPGGHVWRREYDARRNVTAVLDPMGNRWTFEVDARGLPARSTDPVGRSAHSRWTAAGLLAEYVDRTGARTAFEFDVLGRAVAWTNAAGTVARYRHDRAGRVGEFTDVAGRSGRMRYTPDGYLAESIDPLGRVTTFRYGVGGRRTETRSPAGRVTRNHFDTEGRLIGVEGTGQKIWRYERDAAGRVIAEHTWDGRTLRYEYDRAGRLTGQVNARGQRVQLLRDAAGRLLARVLPDGTKESFRYDPRGMIAGATNAAANVARQFDPCGRILAESMNGRTVTSAYDPIGNRVERASPLGRRIRYEYDPEGRLVAAADGATELFRSTLDALGRERRRVTPGGTTWEWDYLPSDAMSAVRVRGRHSFERTYSYDAVGTPTGQDDSVFGSVAYTHDPDGNLLAATRDAGSVEEFAYDRDGAIRPAGSITLTRDLDGNVVEKQTSTGRWNFEYDPLGRLARANGDGGAEVSFAYDPFGRRVRKAAGAHRVEYIWDNNQTLGEFGADPAEYLFRPGTHEPMARLGTDGAVVLECDPIGLPRSAIRPDGEVVWQAAFEPFGELREERGIAGLIPLRFPGQFADPETGLFYNRFRYHDPEARAYTSPDPYGPFGGAGVWNYVPSPMAWCDPYGLSCNLKFAPNDLVYGPSARGKLRELQETAGGRTLTDIPKPDGTDWTKHSFNSMDNAAKNGDKIHFDLSNMEDMDNVLANTGKHADRVTSKEVRYLRDNWDKFSDTAKFYNKGPDGVLTECNPPWIK